MKYTGYVFLSLGIPLLVWSCVERIDIRLDDGYTRLVVDGSITTDTMAHTILLSKTTSFYYDQPAPAVTGAIVEISDGTDSYMLNEGAPGVYQTEPSVFGVPGKTYTLNIKLAGLIGGFTDYSARSTLFPVNPLDSVSLEFHPDWADNGIWEVKIFVQDPPTEDYYRFLISKNNQLVTDTLDEWFVTDDRFFNGNYAYAAPIAYLRQGENDEVLNKGDTVTVEMNSIGKDYANFIWNAQSEVRGSNPLFSGPPANVKGNIDHGAIGFFSAYSASRSYSIVTDSIK